MERRSTIHPQEIDSDGNAAVIAASKGDIRENFNGVKNIINVITNIRNNVMRSLISYGGVKNIFAISIFTLIIYSNLPTFSSTNSRIFPECIKSFKVLICG